ncbi:N-formylglutamate amidohydrolase [Lichenicola cladoniae]|uniref:N-formylglutamate amidohydrolase n=1 Tax=Lichenicola cladoniae TaxID=1484109 RepID=A0A6M8HQH2_9PROT|nr:N-formylglutamate amidohydrolase [Lichenicola cladoniae]NPD67880.1 N-formylglutamate amidohydrolase [Acetobacteraceae bacterium]QKE90481.1 N-formylglutamate amidohydrolase [Lichenicola cladoniae]
MTRPSQLRSAEALADLPFRILRPNRRRTPLLLSLPHSGRVYPRAFVEASRLDFQGLRRSEDCFVDQLFEDATDHGVPQLVADFPRVYCDVNREAWELDPAMFADKLPPWCNTRTARVTAGFGTIARLVSSGEPIYAGPLVFAEAEGRIKSCWQPYHTALGELIQETRDIYGSCVLLDCHSMPTDKPGRPGARQEPQFILGDAHGTSCDPALPKTAQDFLEGHGFLVRRNDPYAGGYVTRHYGRPRQGVHTLQLEIARALYMDQSRYQPIASFGRIRQLMSGLVACLADASRLLPA